MSPRNPNSSRWNPERPVSVTAEEYEREVVAWLRVAGANLTSFKAEHQVKVQGSSGEYAFDGIAEFTILGGARIVVLVECKHHANPIKRDDVLALDAKLKDVGAQKAMLFSTCGFQRGALAYAAERGIATVTFIDGKLTYETKGMGAPVEPPPWVPRFAGWFISDLGATIRCSVIGRDSAHPIGAWVTEQE